MIKANIPPSAVHASVVKLSHSVILHGDPPNLFWRPVFSHVFRPQLMDLVIQMLPKHCSESLHDCLHLPIPQVSFPALHIPQVLFELVQSLVDLRVLSKELKFLLESRHFSCKNWEDVLLLDSVVNCQVVDEVVAGRQECPDAHALRSLACFASTVQKVPSLAKVFMLVEERVLGQVQVRFDWSYRTNMSMCSANRLYVLNS